MRNLSIGLAAAFALTATAASAHPKLVAASPGPGATVAGSPMQIRITFSEAIYPKLSGVVIRGPGGAVMTGPPSTTEADRRVLAAPIQGNLGPGRYTVVWRAVSRDTHRVSGRFAFTVK